MKEILLSFLYTKSRALPNSITIAFSSPKLAKPPALPPPPHEGAIFFRSRNQKFPSLSTQEPGSVSGKRESRSPGAGGGGGNAPPLAAPGAS